MSLGSWVALVVLVAFMLPCWWLVWRLWHRRELRTSSRNPYAPEQQEAIARAFPAAVVALTAGCLMLVLVGLLGQHTLAGKIVIGVLGIVFFGSFPVAVSAQFRGRPRWAIAPLLRDREAPGDYHLRPDPRERIVMRPGRRVTPGDVLRTRRAARQRRAEYQRAHPTPTAWREGMPEGWLDPELEDWVEGQMREEGPESDA